MKLRITLVLLTALSFSGCTNAMNSLISPTANTTDKTSKHFTTYNNAPEHKLEQFSNAQRRVGLSTRNDPNYKSFAPILTTEADKDWFNNAMYLLWDRQITKGEYIAKGTARYPAYKYEFTFIANNF